jgi:hypothetical protein
VKAAVEAHGGAAEIAALLSTGQPAGKIAETDGADGVNLIDTPTGGGGGGADWTHPPNGYVSQVAQFEPSGDGFQTGTNLDPSKIYFCPLFIPKTNNYDQIDSVASGIYILGGRQPMPAGAKARAGIYLTGANGLPGSLLFDAGEISFFDGFFLTQGARWTFSPLSVPAGTVWIAMQPNDLIGFVGAKKYKTYTFGVSTATAENDHHLSASRTYGPPLPDPAPTASRDPSTGPGLSLHRP